VPLLSLSNGLEEEQLLRTSPPLIKIALIPIPAAASTVIAMASMTVVMSVDDIANAKVPKILRTLLRALV
jgi:hypothetical protein